MFTSSVLSLPPSFQIDSSNLDECNASNLDSHLDSHLDSSNSSSSNSSPPNSSSKLFYFSLEEPQNQRETSSLPEDDLAMLNSLDSYLQVASPLPEESQQDQIVLNSSLQVDDSSVSQNQPKKQKKWKKSILQYKDPKTRKTALKQLFAEIESTISKESMTAQQFWEQYLLHQKGAISNMITVLKKVGENEWNNEVQVSLLQNTTNCLAFFKAIETEYWFSFT